MPERIPLPHGGRQRRAATERGHPRLALDEGELAARWGIAVKTLRRWRQEHVGPTFLKLGSRVTYLVAEVEAYERRVSRFGTFAGANQ